MSDEKQAVLHLTVDSDINLRKGCFSDLALVSEKDGIARIDFLLGDMSEGDGSVRCALVSRIFMTHRDLVNLKNMIDDHLAATGKTENPSNES